MRRRSTLTCLLLTMALLPACRSGHGSPAATQENFGVDMARINLWREAEFRFRRAVQLNPNDAQAHNNLAVAHEANGDFESAAREYREAMRLDKTSAYIQKNYSRYVEFSARNKKRQRATAVSRSSEAALPSGSGPVSDPNAAAGTPAAPPAVPSQPPGSTAQPTGSAPAAIPPPNPAPVPPPASPSPKPPGDGR